MYHLFIQYLHILLTECIYALFMILRMSINGGETEKKET
jgi:hypothetical protein